MVVASVLNMILDPILIFGVGPVPAMGLNGAAMAALLARASIFFGTFYFMRYRLDMLTFNKPDPGELRKSWRDILHVGLPAAGTNVIIPIATAIITAMLAGYGPEAVAGFGVASRIEAVMLVIFYAMSAIIGPFVGQNVSAGMADRINEALKLCLLFCLAAGLVIAAILAALSGVLPNLFSENEEVTRVARLFLWIAPISYGAYGVVMVMCASFNGIGSPMPAVVISVARMGVIYVPIALLLNPWFGVAGIFAAYAIANIVTGAVSYVWARSATQAACDRNQDPIPAPGTA
jgi:Na+-driven multidrug efflux pump